MNAWLSIKSGTEVPWPWVTLKGYAHPLVRVYIGLIGKLHFWISLRNYHGSRTNSKRRSLGRITFKFVNISSSVGCGEWPFVTENRYVLVGWPFRPISPLFELPVLRFISVTNILKMKNWFTLSSEIWITGMTLALCILRDNNKIIVPYVAGKLCGYKHIRK